MLVLFTVIIVDMRVSDAVAHQVIAFDGAAFDVRVTDVEAEAHIVQMRFLDELRERSRRAKFIGSILQCDGDAALFREDCQMLERVERRVELARVGGLPAGGEMQRKVAEGNFLGNVERALHFVHRFDAPDALRIGDGDGDAAGSSSRRVAIGGRVQ